MMTNKKTLAFQVDDTCEGCSTIVFHHHGLAAKRIGADELGYDFDEVNCSRAAEFDQFAELGYIPPIEQVKRGWWFKCLNCHTHISEDEFDISDLVEHGRSGIFCSKACHKEHHDNIEKVNSQHKAFNEWFMKTELFPYIDVVNWAPGYPWLTMVIEFKFPGCRHLASARLEHDENVFSIGIPNIDLIAWRRFVKPLKSDDGSFILDWKDKAALPELTPNVGRYGF
jgi:hypothetical protein